MLDCINCYVISCVTSGRNKFPQALINAPLVEMRNYQRDGIRQRAIPRGRVTSEPSSQGGGCPFWAGTTPARTLRRLCRAPSWPWRGTGITSEICLRSEAACRVHVSRDVARSRRAVSRSA